MSNWWPLPFKRFLNALTAPVLDALKLHFTGDVCLDSSYTFVEEDLDLDDSILKSLSTIEIIIGLGMAHHKFVWLLLHKTPRLRHFILEVPQFFLPKWALHELHEVEQMRAPALDTVLFRSCRNMNDAFFRAFITLMQKARQQSGRDGVTKITLSDCWELQNFETDEEESVKIEWSDV